MQHPEWKYPAGPVKALLRWRPPRIALLLVLAAAAMHALVPARPLPALPVAGGLLGVTGFLVMLRAWWLFRLADTAICPTATTSTLVTGDIFAATRNPMYLGMLLMLVGLALATGSVPFYVTVIVYFLILDRAFCPYEETKLHRAFGARYAAYCDRVRRWI